jgi:type III restriction enzyme
VIRLIDSRKVTVEQLARQKFRLRSAVGAKIEECRRAQAKNAFNALKDSESLEVSPDVCFSYDEDRYAPTSVYEGPYKFTRHYFARVGELKREGEETDCAILIDRLDEVKHWVRNLQRPESSFWLPTSTDKFYPDFVAALKDGRILVVEYKGEHLWSNDDSREKRELGEIWARLSGGRCLFVMPKGKDWRAITAVL